MKDEIKNPVEKYQDFFNFMNEEYNLVLTQCQMDEIIIQAQKMILKTET